MKYKRNKDKDFWQMARAYLHDFMPAVRNQSDKSVAAYKQSLNSYLSFLENTKGLKEDQVTFEAFSRSNVKDRYSIVILMESLTSFRLTASV